MQCAFLRVRSLEQPPRVLTCGTNQRNKYTKRRNGYLFDRTRVPEIQGVPWEEQRGYRTQSKNSLSLFPHWNPAILYLCWSRDFVVCVSICLPPPLSFVIGMQSLPRSSAFSSLGHMQGMFPCPSDPTHNILMTKRMAFKCCPCPWQTIRFPKQIPQYTGLGPEL